MYRLRFGASILAIFTVVPAAAADTGGDIEIDDAELHDRVFAVSAKRIHANLAGSRLTIEANLGEGSVATIASHEFGFGSNVTFSIGIEAEYGELEETWLPETVFGRPMTTRAELFAGAAWSTSETTTVAVSSHGGCVESDVRALDCATDIDSPRPGTRRLEFGADHDSSGFAFAASAWLLELERDLDGVAASPLTSTSTSHRVGTDLSISIDLGSALRLESSVLASTSSTGAAASRFAAVAKLAVETEIGLFAGLGLRALVTGTRANDSGPPLVDIEAGYRTEDVELGIEIENTFDNKWPGAQLGCDASSGACATEAFSPSQPLTGKLIAKLRY